LTPATVTDLSSRATGPIDMLAAQRHQMFTPTRFLFAKWAAGRDTTLLVCASIFISSHDHCLRAHESRNTFYTVPLPRSRQCLHSWIIAGLVATKMAAPAGIEPLTPGFVPGEISQSGAKIISKHSTGVTSSCSTTPTTLYRSVCPAGRSRLSLEPAVRMF
jgi:hypothetical protein